MDKKICFFTVATGRWKIFILPYIFSVLYFNKDAFVEILTRGEKLNQNVHNLLVGIFGNSFLVSDLPQVDPARFMPDCAMRFILEPQTKLEYTYIGDVDILILESFISTFHAGIIKSFGGYYSNIIRTNDRRKFTGLHCVKTKSYFNKTRAIRNKIICETGSDEILLYDIVKIGIGDPVLYKNVTMKEHGFHLSLMREPKPQPGIDKPGWAINNPKHQRAYFELKNTKEWQAIYPFFDNQYKLILKTAEENF